jgi:hypothetical protein
MQVQSFEEYIWSRRQKVRERDDKVHVMRLLRIKMAKHVACMEGE